MSMYPAYYFIVSIGLAGGKPGVDEIWAPATPTGTRNTKKKIVQIVNLAMLEQTIWAFFEPIVMRLGRCLTDSCDFLPN